LILVDPSQIRFNILRMNLRPWSPRLTDIPRGGRSSTGNAPLANHSTALPERYETERYLDLCLSREFSARAHVARYARRIHRLCSPCVTRIGDSFIVTPISRPRLPSHEYGKSVVMDQLLYHQRRSEGSAPVQANIWLANSGRYSGGP
jgi:hypothetical protein